MICVITTGSQGKNPDVAPAGDEPRQFAHQWVDDDPSDRGHQASNFLNYARALGDYVGPIVLLGGPLPEGDDAQVQRFEVDLDGWRSIVQSATGMAVEIRW